MFLPLLLCLLSAKADPLPVSLHSVDTVLVCKWEPGCVGPQLLRPIDLTTTAKQDYEAKRFTVTDTVFVPHLIINFMGRKFELQLQLTK